MTTDTFSLFFAMLTVAANVMVAAGAGLAVAARVRPGEGAARSLGWLREQARWNGLPLAWAVALVATLGSLYYSEVAHFVPCKLCWYQRIAMYPLAVVLGIAVVKHDVLVRRYVLPVVGIGAAISVYHYLLERFPNLGGASACDPAAPCTIVWVWKFHYISIPFMALSGFALIALCLLLLPGRSEVVEGEAPAGPETETVCKEGVMASLEQ